MVQSASGNESVAMAELNALLPTIMLVGLFALFLVWAVVWH